MNVKQNKKLIIAIIIAVAALILLGYFIMRFAAKSGQSSGEIFLYGEKHSNKDISLPGGYQFL